MSPRKRFVSNFPLDSLDDSRAFIVAMSKAFLMYDEGDSAGTAFGSFAAGLGYIPIDGERWVELRHEFISLCENSSDAPEVKTATLMAIKCPWLESPFVMGRREAEKRPAPKGGKQPPIPSPFSRF